MKNNLLRHWPLYVSIAVFASLMGLIVTLSCAQNHGLFIYAGDDPYISMAVARTFAHHGVWGVTPYHFTSASSTILWIFVLSLTDLIWPGNHLGPLLWNLLFALLVLVVGYAILNRYKVPAKVQFAALLSVIVLVPLPTVVMSGMEHTLQTLVSFLTVFVAGQVISGESPNHARRHAVLLLLLAPVATTTRFEGMFLIAAIGGLLLLRRRWLLAGALGLCGFLPVLIHGIISVAHGWFWFPASVLLKATLPQSHSGLSLVVSVVNSFFVNAHQAPHMLTLLIAVLVVYIAASGRGSAWTESRQVMGAVLAALWLAQLEFVGGSPLYRYDAHLCALSFLYLAVQVPVIVPQFPRLLSLSTWANSRNIACVLLGAVLVLPQIVKGGRLLWFLPLCTNNLYEQQYQMGLFVHRYYQGSTVALNDIGAVNFLADIHCLDVMGLATIEVARERRRGTFGIDEMGAMAKQTGARIAIIYDTWFPGQVPQGWVRVGRWTIPNNVLNGGDTVCFYAVSPGEAQYLSQSLTDFSSQLPADVIQRGQ